MDKWLKLAYRTQTGKKDTGLLVIFISEESMAASQFLILPNLKVRVQSLWISGKKRCQSEKQILKSQKISHLLSLEIKLIGKVKEKLIIWQRSNGVQIMVIWNTLKQVQKQVKMLKNHLLLLPKQHCYTIMKFQLDNQLLFNKRKFKIQLMLNKRNMKNQKNRANVNVFDIKISLISIG